MDKFVKILPKKRNLPEVAEKTIFNSLDSEKNQSESEDANVNLNTTNEPSSSSLEEFSSKPKKKKNYTQKFSELWTKEFDWIINKNEIAYCKYCETSMQGDAFHFKRHQSSASHVKRVKTLKSTVKLDFNQNKHQEFMAFENKVKQAELKMTAYLCEKNLPFLLMDSLPELCAAVFTDSSIAKALKIKRKKCTQLATGVIAPFAKEKIINHLKVNKFSLVIDETTDISTKKSLVIVARYFNNNNNMVQDRFFDLIGVESATSLALFQSIKQLLMDNKIPFVNMIGFGADNASVMMGQFNGVQAHLKTISPHIVVQGCSCHSLHLCASNACKKLPNNVEQFVRDIYAYFSHSSKRIEEFKECQIFCNEKPNKILRPSQTRWLSLRMVANRILEHWNSLTLFFQRAALEDNLPSAKSILNALTNPVYKIYLMFLNYILELVTKLNLEMQSEKSRSPVLLNNIVTLYKTILKCFIRNEILTNSDISDINVSDKNNFIHIKDLYLGAKVETYIVTYSNSINEEDLSHLRMRCLEFYIELSEQIKKRFDFKNEYLQFAAYFTPRNAISGDIRSIAKGVLLFPYLKTDIELINMEWQLLSELEIVKKLVSLELNEFWKQIFEIKNEAGEFMFDNLKEIVSIILSLPHSSASAERVFSQLSLIKTKIRNSLLIDTCAGLIHVKDMLHYNMNATEWIPDKEILKYNKNIETLVVIDDL